MKSRGVLLLALCLTLSGCMTGLIDRMTGEDKASEIRKTGTAAKARVIRIWDTGMTLNNDPIVGFRLEVHPDGMEPFEAETQALIGRLDIPQVQPGRDVPVKFDPKDHTRVALDLYVERK